MIKTVTPSSSGVRPNGNVRFSATSTSTSAYLSDHVGRVLVGTVLAVTDPLAGDGNASRQNAQALSSTPGNYRVEINVQGQKLSLESAVAPRAGQQLELEVLDARTVKILLASTSSARGKEISTGAAAENLASNKAGLTSQSAPAPTERSEPTQRQPAINIIQSALRLSLPQSINDTEFAGLSEQISKIAALPAGKVGESTAKNTTVQVLSQLLSGALNKTVEVPSHQAQPTGNTASKPQSAQLSQAPLQATASSSTASSNSATANRDTNNIAQNQTLVPELLKQIQAQSPVRYTQLQNAVTQLQQAAQALAASTLPATALADPAQLAETVRNSGLFYEPKLLQRLQALDNRPATTTVTETARQSRLSAGDIETLRADPAISRDAKHNTLKLAQSLARVLQLLEPPAAAGQTSKAEGITSTIGNRLGEINNAIVTNFWPALDALQPSQPSGAENSSQTHLSDSITALIKQLLATLARTQSQQWFNLGSQLASNETPTPQSWVFVIPLWHQDQPHAINVQIDREQQQQQQEKNIPERWAVRLRFDLEEYGALTALATVREKAVTAVFWSAKPQLAARLESELAQLKSMLLNAGLNVTHLLSRVGEIPSDKSLSTSQLVADSLIDYSI